MTTAQPGPAAADILPLEIVLVVDRSGSMNAIRQATIAGLNEFLAQHRTEGPTARVTLYRFDHEFEPWFESVPSGETPQITAESYVPRGTTALLDAIGQAVERTRTRIDCRGEASRVLLAIMTDGLENASRRFNRRGVRNLLDACQRQGWEVMFLGANMDAVAEAEHLGIKRSRAATFAATGDGATRNCRVLGKKVTLMRACCASSMLDYTDEEREALSRK